MKPASQRLPYLDWVRGCAALVMLQGHVFQSFLRDDLRDGGPYVMSQFAGGMPPAVFLFLLGVTFAFLMDSQERERGFTPGALFGLRSNVPDISSPRRLHSVCSSGFFRPTRARGQIFFASTF